MSLICSNRHCVLAVLPSIIFVTIAMAADQCDIPNSGKAGSKNSVVLSVFECAQAQSSPKAVCNLTPSSKEVLNRGEVVDLKHDVNGHAVTAKFFGDEVCVAYRDVSILNYKETKECTSICFTEKETETYHTNLICNIDCAGGFKLLEFVVSHSNSARQSTLISSVVLLAICISMPFGFSF